MTRIGFVAFPNFQVLSLSTFWLPPHLLRARSRNVAADRPRSDIALTNIHIRATPNRTQHKELEVPKLADYRSDPNGRASILLGFPRKALGPRSCGQHWRCELVV